MTHGFRRGLGLALLLATGAATAQAQPAALDTVRAGRFDNGRMWTFDHPPVEYFREAYGFAPDAAWFERARLGALRLPGCTASFVSPNGLVMTNHHCGRDAVDAVVRPGEDLLNNGFVATTLTAERRSPEYYADLLVDIRDVTDEVDRALGSSQTGAERQAARQRAFQAITQRMQGERGEGYVTQVISLYNGSKYSAYTFRRFDDVRLVMTPELQLGFYGGDPDNFTYPRYALDMTFFRVYENDQPYKPQHYFKWALDGSKEGDAVFVIGNPGSTNRLEPVSLLEWRRDVQEKELLGFLRETKDPLWAEYQRTNSSATLNDFFGVSNSEKAYGGRVRGLNDPYLMARRRAAEASFRAASPDGARALDALAALQNEKREMMGDYAAFTGFSPTSPYTASTLRRAYLYHLWTAQNRPEQIGAALAAVPNQSGALESALLEARIRRILTATDGAVFAIEGSTAATPAQQAAYILSQSVFVDSARTAAAIAASTGLEQDPALLYVRSFADRIQRFQSANAGFAARQTEALADLGRARFAVYGYNEPPDATFSLRIADGVVAGYAYNGTIAPAYTTYYGLYDRNASFKLAKSGTQDWALPRRWQTPPASFDKGTPLNFVATADIIGGNSGSAIVNKNLEVVGLVFDGNIESLPGSFIFAPETMNRTVAVDVRGMYAALDHIYDADRIARELRDGGLYRTEAEADRGTAPVRRTPAPRTPRRSGR